jgi:hypothetical protein
MRLYDALWKLAAADLRSSLENKECGKLSAATPRLEVAVASPDDAVTGAARQEWGRPGDDGPSN